MAVKRLDRLLSELGVATRSELRQMIKSGRVTVDGAAAVQPDMKIEEQGHTICVDGAELCTSRLRYFMMDKPEGVLSATEDKRQETVLDILPPDIRRIGLFPVGRLDKDTSGLLLLTKTQAKWEELTQAIRERRVEREYVALVKGRPTAMEGVIDAPLGRDRKRRTRRTGRSTSSNSPAAATSRSRASSTAPTPTG